MFNHIIQARNPIKTKMLSREIAPIIGHGGRQDGIQSPPRLAAFSFPTDDSTGKFMYTPDTRKNWLLGLGVLWALGVASSAARADHLLPPVTLECSVDFPCSAEIRPRVSFWVEVFRGWGKKTAVLHDPDQPQRVYAVFDTGHGCHRAARAKVAKRRADIAKSLRNIAAKVESKRRIVGTQARHLAALFAGATGHEIRAAAANIRCQSGVRDEFIAGLARYHRYSSMVDQVLAEHALPADIRYLPFVESAYNPAAYSKAGAAGMWQIMPKTARVLGLKLNAAVDERLDPHSATRAAARYLQRARNTLTAVASDLEPSISEAQVNPFIITSYNYGVSGMTRAIRQSRPDFITVLQEHKSPSFRVAVKNFYASFLAARHVAVNAERYFGVRAHAAAADEYAFVLPRAASIARIKSVFGLSEAQLRPLNRALTRNVWRGWRQIPAGYTLRLPGRADQWLPGRAQLAALPRQTVAENATRYTVRRGDTACGIARATAVNCRALIQANRLGKKAVIYVGQKLFIPQQWALASAAQAATATAQASIAQTGLAGALAYRVRRGDTACRIAARFVVDCRALISHNQLGPRARILVGQMLSIPGAAGGAAPVELAAAGGEIAANQPGSGATYQVRSGDSACQVAQRWGVDCAALRRINQLNRRATIYPGQKLKIPGRAAEVTAPSLAQNETAQPVAGVEITAEIQAATTPGDREAPPQAAAGEGITEGITVAGEGITVAGEGITVADEGITVASEGITVASEGITVADEGIAAGIPADEGSGGLWANLWPGAAEPVKQPADDVASAAFAPESADETRAAATEAAGAVDAAATLDAHGEQPAELASYAGAADDLQNLLNTLPALSVIVTEVGGVAEYAVRVEADETLGHFADWLGIGFAGPVRRINGLSRRAAIVIGQRLLLPATDATMIARFEQRRSEYHQVLSESIQAHYHLTSAESYIVRRGDSPWSLSMDLGFPIWLLYRLNPGLRAAELKPGQTLILPELTEKSAVAADLPSSHRPKPPVLR